MKKEDTGKNLPLYLQIREILLNNIREGIYAKGSFLKTEADLCKEFQVSRVTIRKALDSLVKEGWIERKSGSGTIVKGPVERKKKVTKVIGLIVPSLKGSFLSEIVRGIELKARSSTWTLSLSLSDDNPKVELECIDHLLHSGIEDLIILPCENSKLIQKETLFEELDVSLVLIDRDQEISYPHDFIGSDNSGGCYSAVRHLHNQGYSKIGFVQYNTGISSVIQRFQGFKQAVGDFKLINLSEDPILLGKLKNIIDELKREIPFALVAVNDEIALEVMKILRTANLEVGKDVAIIGFDNSRAGEFVQPPLTTVLQNPLLIGQNAADALLDQKDRSTPYFQKISIPTQLYLRKSCGE